jgi:hypothetical protein
MAFINKSERKIELLQGEVNSLGPGQYLSGNTNKLYEQSKIPFNTYTYRTTSLAKNDYPGPGSYEYDDKYEKMAKIMANSSLNDKKEPLYKYLDYNFRQQGPFSLIVENDNKKAAFGTKDKRFKPERTVDQVPGPGFYTKSLVDQENSSSPPRIEVKSKKVKKTNLMNESGSPKRVVTIPGKFQSFGYELNSNGELVMNEDPDINIRYQGIKDDTVGPGSYNVVKSKDWIKNSLNWGKMHKSYAKDKGQHSTVANSTLQTSDNNPSDLNSISGCNKRNIDKLNFKQGKEKIFRQISENRKKLLDFKSTSKDSESLIEKFLFSEQPGPGYYNLEEVSKAQIPKPEKFQVFGSSSPRFPTNKEVEQYSEIGPGYYHKEETKMERDRYDRLSRSLKMNYVIKHSGSAEKNKEKKQEFTNKIGPGSYEPKMIEKKSNSNVGNFGSLQKRFIEKISEKEDMPGPGSYIDQNNWDKSPEKETKQENIRKYFASRRNDFEVNLQSREKFEVPPVGTYDTNIGSLVYGIKERTNPYQSVIAPFSSMQKRFTEEKYQNENIGPGMYYKEKKPKTEQVYPPFKNSSDRVRLSSNDDNKVGPGEYNRDNYFDWNKKSYNILYI